MAEAGVHWSLCWMTLPVALCMAGTLSSLSLSSNVTSMEKLFLTAPTEVGPLPWLLFILPSHAHLPSPFSTPKSNPVDINYHQSSLAR